MNKYSKEYKRLQMRLDSVRSELKNCNFLGKDWQRLDAEETEILKKMAKG